MPHAGAGGHALHVTGADHGAVAHAVPVLQGALQHIGNNFHIAVAVGVEASARLHPVLVDDPQGAEAHECRIVIVAEGEGVATVEPTEIGQPPVVCVSNIQHAALLALIVRRRRVFWMRSNRNAACTAVIRPQPVSGDRGARRRPFPRYPLCCVTHQR